MKKFLHKFRYESLDDVEKYDIDYLYDLLRGSSSRKVYYRHMTLLHRVLSVVLVVIFLLCIGLLFLLATMEQWTLLVAMTSLAMSYIVASGNSIDTNYREQVKAQIEYRKYLDDSKRYKKLS